MRKTSLIKVALFLIAIFVNINYLIFLLNPHHADNIGFYILTGIADTIAILIFTSTWGTALYFEVSKSRYYQDIAERRTAGQHLLRQKVAVLITVVNEDLSIVSNTIQSAKNLIGEKEVYLLDDGKRDETQQLAKKLNVRYVTREGNAHYKAGNVNNALRYYVQENYFIMVDADFALDPRFIQQTLPLFVDPKVAAVQTPQVYSNAETIFARGCKHLQDVFYNYLQPGKHLLNSSFCVGTNVICRKKAFVEIGGFTQMHSEDIFTTLKLLENGYRVAFVNEPLAVGLSPTTLISFYTQQNRWARGGFAMLFKHNTLFNKKLHMEQRIQFFLSNFFYLSGVSVLIYLVSPLLAILLNIKPLNQAYQTQWLEAYIPFFAVNFLFFLALMKKHRVSAFILGIFSFVPYLTALRSELISVRQFKWKITNQRSKGIITKLLAPYIIFLCVAVALTVFLKAGILYYNPDLLLYYVWLGLDILIVSVFIVNGYLATSRMTVPAFNREEPFEISTAEMIAVNGRATEKVPVPQFYTTPVPNNRTVAIPQAPNTEPVSKNEETR